jgi:protein-tyrosine phosphatase
VGITKYVLVFALLGAYLTALGVGLGGFGWLLLWPGGSYLVLAAAYAGLGPGVCGKRPDGRLAWWAVALMLPYLLPNWLVWYLQRLPRRKAPCSEVLPGLWLGRRVYAKELPAGTSLVVDLTAEFPEPRGVVWGRSYVYVPTLDALAPPEDVLRELVRKVTGWQGTAYVHCALGHSRSALVAAAVLIARGLAADADHATAILRQVRPSVGLTQPQRRLLKRMAPSLAGTAPPLPGGSPEGEGRKTPRGASSS